MNLADAAPSACQLLIMPCDLAVAIATWVAVGATLVSVWVQFLFTRRTLSADVFTRINDRWESPAMRSYRKTLAIELIAKRAQDVAPEIIEDVIDFFEDLGAMVRKRWLDKDSTWASFSTAVRHYWKACGETYVLDLRHKWQDETYFEEFERLASQMTEIEANRRNKRPEECALDSKNIADFLSAESKLRV